MPTVDINLGITLGTGQVNYLTKIVTVSGSDIVTIGNSDIFDGETQGFWTKTGAGARQTDISVTDIDTGQIAALGLSTGGGVGLSYSDGVFSSSVRLLQSEAKLRYVDVGGGNIELAAIGVLPDDVVVKSNNITTGTYAYFDTDINGAIVLRSGATPGGGTTTNPLTIGTGLTGGSFNGSSPVTITIDSSVVTLTGTQTLTNKSGNISQWTNDSGYLTTITGIAAGGELSGTYANPTLLNSAVIGKVLTGYVSGAGTVAATDTILQAINKLNGNTAALVTGVSSVNGLTGAVALTGTSNRITISGANVFDIGTDVVTLTGSQALTNKTYNGNTFTAGTGTLTIAASKTATFSNTITFAGTDSTTITMPTATSTVLANNLGLSGGTTLIGGTAATDKIIIQTTSGNQVTGVSNLLTFKSGNNGASELMRIGDGLAANIGELSIWAAGQSSATTHIVRAGTNFTYLNAGTDLRLQVGAVSYLNCLSGAGTFAVQKPMTFASGANVTLVAGSTTLAPLVFTSGTNKTTPAAGSVEYNGQFSMTPIDATRRFVTLAASSTKTTAGAPYTNDGYITLNINGTDVKVMTTA